MNKLQGKIALIVDDEPLIRELFSIELQKNNVQVHEASNGRDAFSIVENEKVDFVISDVVMANGSGIEFLENYSELQGDKPIVVMISGYSDLSAEKAQELGASKLFSKPFQIDEILGFIAGKL